jgi:hypothetical protein
MISTGTNTLGSVITNTQGFVGINVSPTTTFDVNGSSLLRGNVSATSDTNTLGNLYTNSQNFVGINNTSPAYTLDINGTVSLDQIVSKNTSGTLIISNVSATTSSLSITSIQTSNSSNSNINLYLYGTPATTNKSYISFNAYDNGKHSIKSNANGDGLVHALTLGIASSDNITLQTDGSLFVSNSLIGNSPTNTLGCLLTNTSGTTILSTQQSQAVGSGGSLTVLGGASISKDLYVGGTITSSSDIRLKENISSFKLYEDERMLDKIRGLRGVRYNYKNDPEKIMHVGFIAQDFETHFPEFIKRKDNDGFYTLDYQKVNVILLECVKELQTEVERLKRKVKNVCFYMYDDDAE